MGKGIALQFRQEFSEDYFRDYKRACQSGELAIGKVRFYELKTPKFDARVSDFSPRFIVNFPTKNHWREKSRIEDIEKYQIKSIVMPVLGCGLGGLDWQEVRPLIEKVFVSIPNIEILLFLPK